MKGELLAKKVLVNPADTAKKLVREPGISLVMKKSHDHSIVLSGGPEVLAKCVKQCALKPTEHPSHTRIDTQALCLGSENQKLPKKRGAILVVSDDLRHTCLLKQAFARANFPAPAIFLEGGQEAIDYLNGEYPFEDGNANPWPGLMILDLTMAGISGLDVLSWMRDRERVCQIPVLVIGEIHRPVEISLAYALGAKLFMPKTDVVDQWVRSLRRIVEMYGLAEESSAGVSKESGNRSQRTVDEFSASC